MDSQKIELTKEENKILVDIVTAGRLPYTMLHFNLLSKQIMIKYLSVSDEKRGIILNLLRRIPVGFDMSFDVITITIDTSHKSIINV